MEVQLGDKVWMYVGPVTLVVGHVLDHSPDGGFVALSNVPYDEYQKMQGVQKSQAPITWCPLALCSYIAHIPLEKVREQLNGSQSVGFTPSSPFMQ